MRLHIVATLVTACSLSILLCGCSRQPDRTVSVVFRYDDYSTVSSTDVDSAVFDAFARNRIPFTVGVIPFVAAGDVHDASPQRNVALTSDKLMLLRDAAKRGYAHIALHGYSHQKHGQGQPEFVGLEFEDQVARLNAGKASLGDLLGPTMTFIPPWNAYDSTTVRALEASGFQVLSADTSGPGVTRAAVQFLPGTIGLEELQTAIPAAESSIYAPDPVIVVVFHSYDFVEYDAKRGVIDLPRFQALLEWVRNRRGVRVMSIDQITRGRTDLTADRYARTRHVETLWTAVPPVGLSRPLWYMDAKRVYPWLVLALGAIYGAICSVSALFVYYLLRLIPVLGSQRLLNIGFFSTALALIAYITFDGSVHWPGAVAGSTAGGACLGLGVSLYRHSVRKSRNGALGSAAAV